MNTFEINACLKKIKHFAGTFPCNFIPSDFRIPTFFVVNTSPWVENKSGQQGVHWVAIYIPVNKKAIYFDSFGIPPLQRDIVSFLENNCHNGFKHNTQSLQSPQSGVCGVYCVDFINQISKGKGLREYLRDFKTDLDFNDNLVVERVGCQSSTSLPHFKSKLKTLTRFSN